MTGKGRSDKSSGPGEHHRTFRHTALLAVLVTVLVIDPLTRKELTTVTFLAAMAIAALLLDGRRHRTRVMAAVVGLPVVLQFIGTFWFVDFTWWKTFTLGPFPLVLQLLLVAALFYCGYLILRSLLKARSITRNEIFGTVSLYLIIGLIWAAIYGIVEQLVPGSFGPLTNLSSQVAEGIVKSQQFEFVYFSFVTQSTLGYGDITPQTAFASRLVILQIVMGQFYVAVVVAYLIAVFISQRKSGT